MFCLRPDPAACPDEKASVQARSQSFLPVFQADLSPRLNEVKSPESRAEPIAPPQNPIQILHVPPRPGTSFPAAFF